MIALAGGLVVAGAAWGASLAPTPEQTLGPFYPSVLPEDRDADLLAIKGRAARAQGTVLHLAGRVTDTSGDPVADALLVALRPADGAEPGALSARFDMVLVPAR
jgi:protocatechuate 3,4-dioxygenase beta subunit